MTYLYQLQDFSKGSLISRKKKRRRVALLPLYETLFPLNFGCDLGNPPMLTKLRD